MNIPTDLRYSKDHHWVRQEGELLLVGISAFAQREMGEVVYVDIPTEGESLTADEVFGSIEAVKTISDLILPLEGEVVEANVELAETPSLINTDPYGAGWIIKLKPNNLEDLDQLLNATDYSDFIAE